MNYMKQIAQMLGVELEEEFKIRNGEKLISDCYMFTEYGLYCITDGLRSYKCGAVLSEILNGNYEIVKKPWKPKEKEIMYYIELNRSINQTWFNAKGGFTLLMYSLGNCFKTEEEITPEVLEETWKRCYGKYYEEE